MLPRLRSVVAVACSLLVVVVVVDGAERLLFLLTIFFKRDLDCSAAYQSSLVASDMVAQLPRMMDRAAASMMIIIMFHL